MRVLGVDPGWRKMGLAVVEAPRRVLHAETVNLSKFEDRLQAAHDAVRRLLGSVHGVVIESQKQAQVAQAKRGEFTADVSGVNVVLGLVHALAIGCGLTRLELAPATWKATIGAGGRADKRRVQRGLSLLMEGMPPRCSEHARDAIGIAWAGLKVAGRGSDMDRRFLASLAAKARSA